VPNDVKERVALVVSVDLLARSRIEDAAARAGWKVESATPRSLGELGGSSGELLVLDLDAGGKELLEVVTAKRAEGALPKRIVGFYSHVDKELGAAAAAAGCDAMPRGKFWRTLPELLSG
jgi:DNA-binding response OmpR family regulator